MSDDKSATVTVRGLAVFPDVLEPHEFEGKRRFGIRVLVNPEDACVPGLQAAFETVLKSAGYKRRPTEDKSCVREGDNSQYESHHGRLVFKAGRLYETQTDGGTWKRGRKPAPKVVDRQLQPITAADGLIQNGCEVIVKAEIFAFMGGIHADLQVVQYVGEGEPVGTGKPDNLDGLEALPASDSRPDIPF